MKTFILLSMLLSLNSLAAQLVPNTNDPQSAENVAIEFSKFQFPEMPKWSRYQEVKKAFAYLRDTRFFDWSYRQYSMKRRISWLFPFDGCDLRAELAVENLQDFGEPLPHKVFAFGRFQINSPYLPGGLVIWKMHVAPIVKVGNRYYVLDPALDFKKPLLLKKWLKKLNRNIDDIKVSICNSWTLNEKANCYHPTYHPVDQLDEILESNLSAEWVNLKVLKYDPAEILGENPPWTISRP